MGYLCLMRELTRIEVIEWLLQTFNDAREPLRSSGGEGSGRGAFDSTCLTMPRSWSDGSYQKLEDGLRLLRAGHSNIYWHVNQRYLARRTGVITVVVSRETAGGTLREPRRVTVDVYHPRVNPKTVQEGIRLLSHLIPGEVWLPRDVLAVAAS